MIFGAKIQIFDEYLLLKTSKIQLLIIWCFWTKIWVLPQCGNSNVILDHQMHFRFCCQLFFLSFRESWDIIEYGESREASLMLDLTIIYAGSRQSHPRYNIANFMWRTRETPRQHQENKFYARACFLILLFLLLFRKDD